MAMNNNLKQINDRVNKLRKEISKEVEEGIKLVIKDFFNTNPHITAVTITSYYESDDQGGSDLFIGVDDFDTLIDGPLQQEEKWQLEEQLIEALNNYSDLCQFVGLEYYEEVFKHE